MATFSTDVGSPLSLTHRLGDTSGAFLLRWSEPKSWATAPLNRLCGRLA